MEQSPQCQTCERSELRATECAVVIGVGGIEALLNNRQVIVLGDLPLMRCELTPAKPPSQFGCPHNSHMLRIQLIEFGSGCPLDLIEIERAIAIAVHSFERSRTTGSGEG